MKIISIAQLNQMNKGEKIGIKPLKKYFINTDTAEFAAILPIEFEGDDKAINSYNDLKCNNLIIDLPTFLEYSAADFKSIMNKETKTDFFNRVKEESFNIGLVFDIIDSKNLHKTIDKSLLREMEEIVWLHQEQLDEDLKLTKEICKTTIELDKVLKIIKR